MPRPTREPTRRPIVPETLAERRARLAQRLLELGPNRPPHPEPERWRHHHGQRRAG